MNNTNSSNEVKKTKRKGGRPKLLLQERRRNSIRPGFNDHEIEILEARAESVGLDLVEFVRRLALNQQFIAVPSINRQALVQLSRIGSHLNQIAKVANSTKNVQPFVANAINSAKGELEKITLTLTLNHESD